MIDLDERVGVAMSVRGQFTDPIADPKVTLGALAFANDLGRMLKRIKAAQQVTPETVRRTTLLLAQMIRTSGRFKRGKFCGLKREEMREKRSGQTVERSKADIIDRFALRLLDEWVNDRCGECKGRGIVRGAPISLAVTVKCGVCAGKGKICVFEERIPFFHGRNGPLVFREFDSCGECSGMGRLESRSTPHAKGRRICSRCTGSGKRQVDEAGRAQVLNVGLMEYRRNWHSRFHDMLVLLDSADSSASNTVRKQLRE